MKQTLHLLFLSFLIIIIGLSFFQVFSLNSDARVLGPQNLCQGIGGTCGWNVYPYSNQRPDPNTRDFYQACGNKKNMNGPYCYLPLIKSNTSNTCSALRGYCGSTTFSGGSVCAYGWKAVTQTRSFKDCGVDATTVSTVCCVPQNVYPVATQQQCTCEGKLTCKNHTKVCNGKLRCGVNSTSKLGSC